MAGRGRMMAPHMLHPGAPGLLPEPILPRPGSASIGDPPQPPIGAPQQMPPPMVLIEHKLATQHAEIQKLLSENQRLAAAHLALRQELASARQEVQHLQQQMSRMQMEEEGRMMSLIDKATKLEEDLGSAEPIKAELQHIHNDTQQLNAQRQELMGHIQQMTEELQKSRSDSQHSIVFQSENEKLRQELERARVSADMEKKANTEQEERRQAMEKTLILLAKEVEKLHTDLTNEKRTHNATSHGELYSTGYGMEQSRSSFRDSYRLQQEGASTLAEYRKNDDETTGLNNVKNHTLQESSYSSAHSVQNNVPLSATQNSSEVWNAHIAPNGRTFYHNVITGQTQWELPAKLNVSTAQQREQLSPLTQGQHLLQPHQSSLSPSLQPAQAQIPTQQAGQGHMHQLAAQMSQVIQGQIPYNSHVSQYQMISQPQNVQNSIGLDFQSMTN